MRNNPYLPREAVIVEKVIESPVIFTLRLAFSDPNWQYSFKPGQFNMITLPGVGEIAISIVSDPECEAYYDHTIRVVGRVTRAMTQLKAGDSVGIRGPLGRGWPMHDIRGRDVVVITGGVGCAPTVSLINYIVKRRQAYGRLSILQGVKHSDDFFFQSRFAAWRKMQDTTVLLAADVVGKAPSNWYQGYVTELINQISVDENTCVILCGPELMMKKSIQLLTSKGVREDQCFLTLERSMHCGVGHCGHCQLGPKFICKDGPVFCYPEIKQWLERPGI